MSVAEPTLDLDALRYEEHWQPVLDGAARRLLARLAAVVPASVVAPHDHRSGSRGPRLLDLGAGTGVLTGLAAESWPDAAIIGLDASAAMLGVAERRLAAAGRSEALQPVEWLARDAQATGLETDSIDVVMSSFVLQLVQDRVAVLHEVQRVLAPGGIFGFVTWITDALQLQPDREFDEAVYELELDDPESTVPELESGDYESLDQARDELEEAGFRDIDVRPDTLDYAWSAEAYLHFKASFDERELLDSLTPTDRSRLIANVRRRWANLPASAFRLEAPLVSAVARARVELG